MSAPADAVVNNNVQINVAVFAKTSMPKRSVSVAIGVGIFGLVAGLAAYLIFKKKKNPVPPPGPDTNPEPTDEDCIAKIANLSFEKGFIYLKMADGRYLCCNDPGTIFTNEARGPETKWVVEAFPGGIRIKNQYYNRYLSSEDNGTAASPSTTPPPTSS